MLSNEQKVLFVITKSNWGGAQRYVYDLATGLKADGVSVQVALGGTGTRAAKLGLLAERLTNVDVPVHVIRHFMRDMALWSDALAFFELVRCIRRVRPDVLHVTSSKAGGLGALAGRVCRVRRIVFTSHGLAYDETWRPRWQRALILCSTWLTMMLAHRTILITADSYKRAYRLPWVGRRAVLVHNGVGESTLLAREQARHELTKHASALASSVEALWIGTIAELHPNKRLDLALDAFAALRTQGVSAELVLIGEGEERARLEHLASELKIAEHVHFLGYVADAATYLAAFDIFLLTSRKEGLPYVLLESLVAGIPIVACATGGVPDVVHTGLSGILVEQHTPQALAEALVKIIIDSDERVRLSDRAKDHASEHFSLKQMLSATRQVYNRS